MLCKYDSTFFHGLMCGLVTERRLHRIEYIYLILSDCTVKLSIFTEEDYCIVNLIMIEIIFIMYNVEFSQSTEFCVHTLTR